MKKFYFLAMMAMLVLSTTSCQKDEFNDAPAKSNTNQTSFTSVNAKPSTATSSSNTTVLPTPQNKVDYDKVILGTWKATLNNGTAVTLTVSDERSGFMEDDLKASLTVGDKTYAGRCSVDGGYVRFFSRETDAKQNYAMGFSGKWVEGNKSFKAELIDHCQSLGSTYFSK